jgi:hypothetical protein
MHVRGVKGCPRPDHIKNEGNWERYEKVLYINVNKIDKTSRSKAL